MAAQKKGVGRRGARGVAAEPAEQDRKSDVWVSTFLAMKALLGSWDTVGGVARMLSFALREAGHEDLAQDVADAHRDAARDQHLDDEDVVAQQMIDAGLLPPPRAGQDPLTSLIEFQSVNGPAGIRDLRARLKRHQVESAGRQPGDTLPELPPPWCPERHLTAGELARVIARARSIAIASAHPEETTRSIAILLAEILPRFKEADRRAQDGTVIQVVQWRKASTLATGTAALGDRWRAVVDGAALFEEVQPHGTYGGQGFPAWWRLRAGSFAFDADAPKRKLYQHGSASLDERWRRLQAAAGTLGR